MELFSYTVAFENDITGKNLTTDTLNKIVEKLKYLIRLFI